MWRPPHQERPSGALALIVEIVKGVPRLPSSIPCRKNPALFDLDADENCRQITAAMCASCRALPQCRNWLETLPKGDARGVVAGKVVGRRGRAPK
jgi:hypothetical protein